MNSKIKKNFCKTFKAFTKSTFSRKKKIVYNKRKKIRNCNLKLKLYLFTYKNYLQLCKNISVYKTHNYKFTFI